MDSKTISESRFWLFGSEPGLDYLCVSKNAGTSIEDQREGIRSGSHQHGQHDQQPRLDIQQAGQVR